MEAILPTSKPQAGSYAYSCARALYGCGMAARLHCLTPPTLIPHTCLSVGGSVWYRYVEQRAEEDASEEAAEHTRRLINKVRAT